MESFYNEDLTRQEKRPRRVEGQGRFSDRYMEWYPNARFRASSKNDWGSQKKGKPDAGRIASLFGRVSDNTHTVWRVLKGIDNNPPCLSRLPSRFHPDSDANRGQLRRCVPRPPTLGSTAIEITLIYCGIERMPRSIIIRLSYSR